MHTFNRSNRKVIIETLCLIAVIAIAIAIRSYIMFGTSLIPGMNGGYYLVQTRSIIEKGHLGEHDMPLLFLLQAGFALVIKFLSNMNLESSIFLSVKIFDSVIPALSAIPAYLVTKYLNKDKNYILPIIASAAVVTISYGPLRMLGDFQKNALGMMWFLFMAYFLIKALSVNSKRDLILSLIFLVLCGLTHIGAFGVALVFIVLAALTSMVFISRISKRSLTAFSLTVIGILALLALLKISSDSIRISRLISYIEAPLSLFQFSNAKGMFRAESIQNTIMFGLISVIMILMLAWQRRSFKKWEYVVIIPSVVMTLFLISPFVSQDFSTRSQIMAFAPGMIALAFFFRHSNNLFKWAVATLVVIALIAGLPSILVTASTPSISAASYYELTTLQSSITEPSETLVIARHGLEWWVAWALHTNVAQANAVTSNDWNDYKNVLYIQEISEGNGLGNQPLQLQQPPFGNIVSFAPDQNKAPQPPNQMPQNNQPQNGTLPQGPFSNTVIASSDEITLFKGNYFILYKLPTAITLPGGNK
ncbi:MAG: hypothetical protein ACP5SB_04940 [Caldisericaceae bacterium]